MILERKMTYSKNKKISMCQNSLTEMIVAKSSFCGSDKCFINRIQIVLICTMSNLHKLSKEWICVFRVSSCHKLNKQGRHDDCCGWRGEIFEQSYF